MSPTEGTRLQVLLALPLLHCTGKSASIMSALLQVDPHLSAPAVQCSRGTVNRTCSNENKRRAMDNASAMVP